MRLCIVKLAKAKQGHGLSYGRFNSSPLKLSLKPFSLIENEQLGVKKLLGRACSEYCPHIVNVFLISDSCT